MGILKKVTRIIVKNKEFALIAGGLMSAAIGTRMVNNKAWKNGYNTGSLEQSSEALKHFIGQVADERIAEYEAEKINKEENKDESTKEGN